MYFVYLPHGHISFMDQTLEANFHMQNKILTYIPYIAFNLWSFASFLAIIGTPWVQHQYFGRNISFF